LQNAMIAMSMEAKEASSAKQRMTKRKLRGIRASRSAARSGTRKMKVKGDMS
jgi:hypothetical protein